MANLKLQEKTLSPTSSKILSEAKNKLGFVPNMYEKFAHNRSLLDAYSYSYNSFRVNAGFTPVEQEVILLSVAYVNNCEYCMAAHSFVADNMTKVPAEVTDAIRNGEQIHDSKLSTLSKTAVLLTENRGHLTDAQLQDFLDAGYTESHILGIITGIAVKVMSNYANHNTHPQLDDVFSGRKWSKA